MKRQYDNEDNAPRNQRQRNNSYNTQQGQSQHEVCSFFQRGNCTNYKCQFLHEEPNDRRQREPKAEPMPVCHFYRE